MNRFTLLATTALLLVSSPLRAGDGNSDHTILGRPLSKVDALNIAIANNARFVSRKMEARRASPFKPGDHSPEGQQQCGIRGT
jgi:hypothetical protein